MVNESQQVTQELIKKKRYNLKNDIIFQTFLLEKEMKNF